MELSTASALARSKMNEHGLEDWTFQYDGAKRRAGQCDYMNRTISLSRHFVERNTEERVLDTILHEIAHALTPDDAGHGREWRAICVRIGAKPVRCYSRSDTDMPKGNFVAVCKCGYKSYAFRLRKNKREGRVYHTPCGEVEGKLIYRPIVDETISK